MVEHLTDNSESKAVEQDGWASPVTRLSVSDVPEGATDINVSGNQIASPLQGFGQLWQKTFRVRLEGSKLTPRQVIELWKANFIKFQPDFNHFYANDGDLAPGKVMFIDSRVPVVPNTQGVLPITTGVMILYADDTSFTVITPEGHPESGWNTFSAYEEDGCTVAQIQALTRATDPIYEFGFRFMGGTQMQDKTWTHVLRALSKACGVQAEVTLEKTLVDPRLHWPAAKNIWKNAVFRTMFYKLGTPVRWVRRQFGVKMTQ